MHNWQFLQAWFQVTWPTLFQGRRPLLRP